MPKVSTNMVQEEPKRGDLAEVAMVLHSASAGYEAGSYAKISINDV